MKTFYRHFMLFALVVFGAVLSGCAGQPLPSWNGDAPARRALIEYVETVTAKDSPDYIPVENRVAVFDFDGTLFLETDPTYFDWQLFEHRVLEDPTYKATEEQLAAARASRNGKFPPLDKNRERMVAEAYRGMTVDEFNAFVRKFMAQDQPGFTGLKRGGAYYVPMLEVIDFLRQNDFTVYVISGTERFTMRPLTEALRLPPARIIGSDNTVAAGGQGGRDGLEYIFVRDDKLLLGGANLVKNLQMNKVSAIAREIGVRPVLAFGNTMSDASMLNYTLGGSRYKALGFMLLCDDLVREYGNMAKAADMRRACAKYGWIPVSMRDDWQTIYGDGVTRKGCGK